MPILRATFACAVLVAAGTLPAAEYASLPGGRFASVLPADVKGADTIVAPFALRREPVTNAEFLAFVKTHPKWQRGNVAPIFAEPRYLANWQAATALGRLGTGTPRPGMVARRPRMAVGAARLLAG